MASKEINRIIFSAGGTGGHIFPAVAVANEVKRRYPNVKILFVGAEGRMEMEKVPQSGYDIFGLPIAGLQRKLTLSNFVLPFKIIKSLFKARRVISQFEPEVVVGFGGYASAPTLRTAGRLGIPTVLQEQNSYAGVTNKLLAKTAKKICVAYAHMESFFPADKIVFTGNPIRKEFVQLPYSREEALNGLQLQPNKKTILIIGGSLGARAVNEAVEASLAQWLQNGYQVIWQCGKLYKAAISERLGNKEGVLLVDFIQDMARVYAAADVIVSRAGAMSVSELSLIGKPTVFMPSPNVAEDHQTKNAMALVSEGAAVLVKDVEGKEKLGVAVRELVNDTNASDAMRTKLKQFARPRATEDIVDIIENLIHGN